MRRILHSALIPVILASLALVSCGNSDRKSLKKSIEATAAQLPMTVDPEMVWTDCRYDENANLITFVYQSVSDHVVSPEDLPLYRAALSAEIMPGFEGDGMADLVKRLRPKVRTVFQWRGRSTPWLDEVFEPEDYL